MRTWNKAVNVQPAVGEPRSEAPSPFALVLLTALVRLFVVAPGLSGGKGIQLGVALSLTLTPKNAYTNAYTSSHTTTHIHYISSLIIYALLFTSCKMT